MPDRFLSRDVVVSHHSMMDRMVMTVCYVTGRKAERSPCPVMEAFSNLVCRNTGINRVLFYAGDSFFMPEVFRRRDVQ